MMTKTAHDLALEISEIYNQLHTGNGSTLELSDTKKEDEEVTVLIQQFMDEQNQWQPIETAPKDGTLLELYSDCFDWGGWPNNMMVFARWGDTSVYARKEPTYNGHGDGFLLYGGSQGGEINDYTEVKDATHCRS